MRRQVSSSSPGLTADTIRRYVDALPPTSDTTSLDERTAQAVRSVLGQTEPSWEHRLQLQIDAIMQEIVASLDRDGESGRYVISDIELRGVVARAVSRTTGQFVVDVGRALAADTPALESQFGLSTAIDDAHIAYDEPDLLPET